MRRASLLVLTGLVLGAPARGSQDGVGDPGPSRPARIVSLNMCTDELLLRLVEPERIASVTWLSQNPATANMAEAAGRIPANHGLAEEVLSFRPDLVVAGRYTTRTAVALLERAGVKVVEFDAPQSIPAVEAQIRNFADLVGSHARGEALAAEIEREVAAIPPPAGPRPRAFVLRPNGFTAGRGSLVDEIMTRAGLDNLGARLDLGAYAQVPLETAVLEGANLLVVDDGRGGPPSLATALLQHPALVALRGRIRTVSIPSRLWTCAGPGIVEAMRRLHAAAVAP